jgi:HEAT repeat protein
MESVTSTEEKVAILLRDYSTPESWVNRQLGAQLAAQSNLERYTPTLFLLLEDSNEWVRFHALCALHSLKAESGVFTIALLKLERDPFFRVRAKAKEVLLELNQNTTQALQSYG